MGEGRKEEGSAVVSRSGPRSSLSRHRRVITGWKDVLFLGHLAFAVWAIGDAEFYNSTRCARYAARDVPWGERCLTL